MATAFLSCQTGAEPTPKGSLPDIRNHQFTSKILPEMQATLAPGDIIFRMGTDITSYMFAQLNDTDKRYSHCGIANFEDGNWVVYHSIGGEFNPDQKMLREPLEWFAAPNEAKKIGIYHPQLDSIANNQMLQVVKGWHGMQIPFDMDFDLLTNDRMYCAEMVAKALIAGKQDAKWLHVSKRGNLVYIDTEDLAGASILTASGTWDY